jgi:hypothetical protein
MVDGQMQIIEEDGIRRTNGDTRPAGITQVMIDDDMTLLQVLLLAFRSNNHHPSLMPPDAEFPVATSLTHSRVSGDENCNG